VVGVNIRTQHNSSDLIPGLVGSLAVEAVEAVGLDLGLLSSHFSDTLHRPGLTPTPFTPAPQLLNRNEVLNQPYV